MAGILQSGGAGPGGMNRRVVVIYNLGALGEDGVSEWGRGGRTYCAPNLHNIPTGRTIRQMNMYYDGNSVGLEIRTETCNRYFLALHGHFSLQNIIRSRIRAQMVRPNSNRPFTIPI